MPRAKGTPIERIAAAAERASALAKREAPSVSDADVERIIEAVGVGGKVRLPPDKVRHMTVRDDQIELVRAERRIALRERLEEDFQAWQLQSFWNAGPQTQDEADAFADIAQACESLCKALHISIPSAPAQHRTFAMRAALLQERPPDLGSVPRQVLQRLSLLASPWMKRQGANAFPALRHTFPQVKTRDMILGSSAVRASMEGVALLTVASTLAAEKAQSVVVHRRTRADAALDNLFLALYRIYQDIWEKAPSWSKQSQAAENPHAASSPFIRFVRSALETLPPPMPTNHGIRERYRRLIGSRTKRSVIL